MSLVILTVDQYVINVHDDKNVQEGSKYVLNQGLECGWGIGETKWHNLVLEMAILSSEGSFLHIIRVNLDLIIP